MRHLFRFVLLASMLALCSGASYADSLIGYFNLDSTLTGVASEGTIIFTLNPDGTIAASLSDTGSPSFVGFGFNSPGTIRIPASGFTPTAPYNTAGWSDNFGTQYSGFYCSSCGSRESWTSGTPGEFTSVFQAVGGTTSAVDFYLLEGNGEWGANAQPYSPVATPEPGSLVLLAAGLLAVGTMVVLRKQIV